MNKENEELLKEAKKINLEYHKNWRAKNKDKVKEINKRYWLKKAKQKLEERKWNNGRKNIYY